MLTWMVAFVAGIVADAAPQPPPWAMPSKTPASAAPQLRPFQLKPHAVIDGYMCETAAFTALVFPDGSVDFRRSKPGAGGSMPVRIMPFPLNYKPEALPPDTPSLAGEVGKLLGKPPDRNPKPQIVEGPKPGAPYMFADTMSLCEDPKSRCFVENRSMAQLITATGPLDATEEVMRMVGDDPAKYEKARFLAATAPFRTTLAERTRKRELRQAIEELPNLLTRIWRTPTLTRDERLKIVSALREEVDPSAPGGEAALTTIDAFLKKHVDPSPPAGHKD